MFIFCHWQGSSTDDLTKKSTGVSYFSLLTFAGIKLQAFWLESQKLDSSPTWVAHFNDLL